MRLGAGFRQKRVARVSGPRAAAAVAAFSKASIRDTGTSCHEQLKSGLKRQVFYPTELLAVLLPQFDG